MRPSYERMIAAIEDAGFNYSNAGRTLSVSPDTMRTYMDYYRARGHTFPKSQAIGGSRPPYDPTPEEIDEARREIRRGYKLPDVEYDHARGSEAIRRPTQAELDNAIGDGA
jgi:hypothetical protein